MTRPLKLDVAGDSAGGRKALDAAAAAVDRLRRETDRLEGEFRDARQEAAKLDKQLLETATAAKVLAREFAATSDKKLLPQIEAHNKAAAEIKKVQATIVGDAEVKAKDSAKAWQNALGDLIKQSKGFDIAGAGIPLISTIAKNPALAVAGAAAGTAIAIPLLASIGGAITAATGAGVAGLGIAGAVLGDPQRFKTAWGSVLADVKTQFVDASKPFVGPTLDALRTVGPLVRSWHIDTIFANAAKFVEPLVHGISGAGTGLMKGIGDLVKDGGPAVEALSDGMVRLGEAAGNALSSIASGSEGGATALHDLVTVVSLVIEGFGKVIEGAENAYQFMHDHPWMTAAFTGGFSLAIAYVGELDDVSSRFGTTELGLRKAAEEAGHAFSDQGDDLTALMQKVGAATASYDSLVAAMVNKVFSATMGLDQATLGWNRSLTQLDETIKKNGRSLDIHKEKGQANVGAVLNAVTANQELYQRMIAAGNSAGVAADAYNTNTAALEAQLRKAGLTSTQIDGLIGKYRDVPGQVNTQLALKGIEDAINDLNDLIRIINGLPPRKDIYVYTHTGIVGGKEGPGLYASGTSWAPPGLAWVGENGPELMSMRGGERVYTPANSAQMMTSFASSPRIASYMGSASDGTGGRAVTVTFGGNTDSAFATAFQRLVREGIVSLN